MLQNMARLDQPSLLVDRRLSRPAHDVAEVLPRLSEIAPYAGLRPITASSAPVLWGRDNDIARLLDTLTSPDHTDMPVHCLVGATGSGKTSLIHAGLIPNLPTNWSARVVHPQDRPLVEVTHAIADLVRAPGRTVLVIDQGEQLWTRATQAERDETLDIVLDAAGSMISRVVIVIRADFYAAACAHPQLALLLQNHQILLSPLDREQLCEAISGPASQVGAALSPGLVARIVDDAMDCEPFLPAAPLVSHCLATMWNHSARRRLTHDDYESAGGVNGSIELTAEKVFSTLTSAEQVVAQRLLLRFVLCHDELPTTCGEYSFANLTTAEERILNQFISAGLLVAHNDTVSVGHDTLMTAWPRLHSWIEQHVRNLSIRRAVDHDAHQWQIAGQDNKLLLSGDRIDDALSLIKTDIDLLTTTTREYIRSSINTAATRENALRRQAERDHRQNVALRVVVVLLIAAIVCGYPLTM